LEEYEAKYAEERKNGGKGKVQMFLQKFIGKK